MSRASRPRSRRGPGRVYADHVVGGLNRAILRLAALPCPVIAQVQGALTGGALGLVLAADLVAMDRAAFIQPYYVRVGFAPDGGWTAMLPARIGARRARAIQLLNTRLSALRRAALGTRPVGQRRSGRGGGRLAGPASDHDPGAMAATKRLTRDLPISKPGSRPSAAPSSRGSTPRTSAPGCSASSTPSSSLTSHDPRPRPCRPPRRTLARRPRLHRPRPPAGPGPSPRSMPRPLPLPASCAPRAAPGDRLAILCLNRVEFFVALFAARRPG
jgi:hypothetical protein